MTHFHRIIATLLLAVTSLFAQGIPLGGGNNIHGLATTGSAVTYTIFGTTSAPTGAANQVIAQGQLATSDATLYSVPAGTSVTVTLIQLANTTTSAVTGVTLLVNGTAASNQILPGVTIPANGFANFSNQAWQIHDIYGNNPSATIPVLCASITAASAAIVNAEAQVAGCTIPANVMAAGTTFHITAAGRITTASAPGNDVFKFRIGTTTLTGNITSTVTAAATASITNQPFWLDILVTVRTAGASGTVVGQGVVNSTNVSTGAFTTLNIVGITTATVAVDTTVQNIAELTAVTGASDSSVTFQNAAIEILKGQ